MAIGIAVGTAVHRRTGGLEMFSHVGHSVFSVHRRTGGLEKQG